MIIQEGKTNWILIFVVALFAGAVSGGLVVYINDTVDQAAALSQMAELENPGKINNAIQPGTNQESSTSTINSGNQLGANKISGDVFKNVKYRIGYASVDKKRERR